MFSYKENFENPSNESLRDAVVGTTIKNEDVREGVRGEVGQRNQGREEDFRIGMALSVFAPEAHGIFLSATPNFRFSVALNL